MVYEVIYFGKLYYIQNYLFGNITTNCQEVDCVVQCHVRKQNQSKLCSSGPPVRYMSMESYGGMILTGETKGLRYKPVSVHFVYHKSHMD
jgi:hypothetical protein